MSKLATVAQRQTQSYHTVILTPRFLFCFFAFFSSTLSSPASRFDDADVRVRLRLFDRSI